MLIAQIKAAQIAARKLRNQVATGALTTLIGDAEMVGKNAGREVTDAEVVAVLKKFMKNVEETLKALPVNDVRTSTLLEEMRIYESFLPSQMTEAELTTSVKEIIADMKSRTASPIQMGMVMGALKLGFEGQYDGKMASTVVKACL